MAWDRDRQRAHRLKAKVRPKQPSDPTADPWELAHEAISELETVRLMFRARGAKAEQYERLDLIAETLRRLAWGPTDDEPPRPISKSAERQRALHAKRKTEAAPQEDLSTSRALARLPHDDPKPSGWSDWQRRAGKSA